MGTNPESPSVPVESSILENLAFLGNFSGLVSFLERAESFSALYFPEEGLVVGVSSLLLSFLLLHLVVLQRGLLVAGILES